MERKSNVTGKFPTPIWTSKIENFKSINEKLLQYIYDLKKNDPEGTQKSNNLGWHSKDMDMGENTVREFFQQISPHIKEVSEDMCWDLKNFQLKITNCWSIINKKLASNAGHIHANSLISSAYYIKANKNSGNLIFDDPRPAASIKKGPYKSLGTWNEGNISITPYAGLLVMFPSYLVHHVQPNMSDDERIILSFNLDIKS